MVGANQYIYKRELQFWSFFPVMLFMHEEKDGSFRYLKVSGKQLIVYKQGGTAIFIVPIGFSDRGFFASSPFKQFHILRVERIAVVTYIPVSES